MNYSEAGGRHMQPPYDSEALRTVTIPTAADGCQEEIPSVFTQIECLYTRIKNLESKAEESIQELNRAIDRLTKELYETKRIIGFVK
jgi:hypothetical protein